MTETEETVLDPRSLVKALLQAHDDWSGAAGTPLYGEAADALNKAEAAVVAALSRAPEAGREGAAERLAIVAEKPAHLIRWGEGDRLDLQSVLAALSPPSTDAASTLAQKMWGVTLVPIAPVSPSPEMGEWRPEVRAFADLMEAQLRANDHKPGWKDDTDLDLFERLGEESAELLAALHRNAKRLMWGDDWVMEDTVLRVGREAADVANFALMIADVCGALKLKENGLSREGLT